MALFAILLTEQPRANRSFVPVIAGFVGVAVLVLLKVDGLGMFISGRGNSDESSDGTGC